MITRGYKCPRKNRTYKHFKMVKNYIDEKQESSIDPYNLAIPYPRNVFTDQDFMSHPKTMNGGNILGRRTSCTVSQTMNNSKQATTSSIALIV
uniref:Uncharacterized protein n=1 Tax=Lactuca sativa TaxID=4236 RepID=A0A9R1V945_LACSA|nr:hypothetical protein LSAT_V11C500253140 [Lactuca sativa]